MVFKTGVKSIQAMGINGGRMVFNIQQSNLKLTDDTPGRKVNIATKFDGLLTDDKY